MSTIIIKVLMDLKKAFPINTINYKRRYSAEEINRVIDEEIRKVVGDKK
jgi:hypothetical protein